MLEWISKRVAVPGIPVKVVLSVGTLASFAWLLGQDLIHPLAIYLLQLYLAF